MEFPNRGSGVPGAAQGAPTAPPPPVHNSKVRRPVDPGKWGRVATVLAVFLVVILLVAAIIVVAAGNKTNDEYSYVQTSKLQAVFLNTGQVYFGNLQKINSNYYVLTNIFYLQTSNSSGSSSSSSSNSNVTLVKLGCELHRPYDQMVINSSQVTFWENLQPGGQVAQAVNTFYKQNPNGQKCADQSSSASTSTGSTTQNAGSSSH